MGRSNTKMEIVIRNIIDRPCFCFLENTCLNIYRVGRKSVPNFRSILQLKCITENCEIWIPQSRDILLLIFKFGGNDAIRSQLTALKNDAEVYYFSLCLQHLMARKISRRILKARATCHVPFTDVKQLYLSRSLHGKPDNS